MQICATSAKNMDDGGQFVCTETSVSLSLLNRLLVPLHTGRYVVVNPCQKPRVGSGAVRIGPLRFLTGGSKSRTKSGFRLFC